MSSGPKTVLIVEDAQAWASTLEMALAPLSHLEVVMAGNGAEALAALNANDGSICAILTDLQMPRMDGFELIERVRSDSRYSRLPIIVLSGDTDPRTPEKLRCLGADAFFLKPYSPMQVRQKLEQLLNVTSQLPS